MVFSDTRKACFTSFSVLLQVASANNYVKSDVRFSKTRMQCFKTN